MIERDADCTLCKLHKTAEHVCLLGSGPRRSEIMVIGEAPGKREDESGVAFVGRSGQYLEGALEQYGLDRKHLWITNAVSCRPPDNRTPSKSEIKTCKVWLDRQIKYVKPKFVLLLGNVPLMSITGEGGIRKKRGKPFEKDGTIYFPTYHPAYVLRNLGGSEEFQFQKDLKFFKEIVDYGGIPKEEGLNYTIIDNVAKFKQLLRDLEGVVSVDIEATCLYPWQKFSTKRIMGKDVLVKDPARVVSIGFGTSRGQYVLPVQAEAWKCPFTLDVIDTMLEEIGERLKSDCILVGHNGKFDFLWLWVHFGLRWYEWFSFDTMLAHYILDENSFHALDFLAKKYFGAPAYDVPLTVKQGKSGTLAQHAEYLALDVFYTRNLRKPLMNELNKDGEVKKVFQKILMPCARLFTEVEYDGVYVNESKMDVAETYLRGELKAAEKAMKKAAEEEGATVPENWGSPDQVAKFLFGKRKDGGLGIPVIEKTKTGKASTSESVIKRIEHPIGGSIIRFRGAKQQLSFFIDGWKPYLIKGRIHPSFKLHGTVTGRLSCEHPNLQQVPRDIRIRELITAPPGWTLLEADLSQIELRVAAELAQEPSMLDAFRRGIDVHWLTATGELARGGGGKHAHTIIRTAEAYLKQQGKARKLRFGEAMEIVREKISPAVAEELQAGWGEKDPEMLWKEIRKKAKAVNFGYLYGMWWKKFKIYARDNYGVIITDEQAQDSREFFFATFPAFSKWHDRQRRYARLNGYVRSLSGRKRRLPAALSNVDTPERREAERQAINSPVQSFANELNLMSALQLRKEFGRDVARIVGTVHDSLLVWVKNEHVASVATRLLEIMSHPQLMDDFEIEVGVPILAEAKIGAWGTGIGFHKWMKKNESKRRPLLRNSREQHSVDRRRREDHRTSRVA